MRKSIKLLIFLIPLFSGVLKAQDTVRRSSVPMIALCTVSVVSGALGDGLNSRTKYASGHILSAVSYASLLAIPFVYKHPNWKLPVTYILIRYALFDALYNVGAKRKLTYEGGKNYYDESVGRMPAPVLDATKFGALGLSVVINLNHKHHEKTPTH